MDAIAPQPSDFWDPRTWSEEPRQFRMYAHANADIECLVDEEDYLYFTQWLWTTKKSPCGKLYFRRAVSRYDVLGNRVGVDTIYLHIDILQRKEPGPPTRLRCIADHWNGNSLDNRRDNLRWATKRENGRNRFGSSFYQRAML